MLCSPGFVGMDNERLNYGTKLIEYTQPPEILTHIHSGRLLIVDSRRRNGLILIKVYHAEFAGPGAAVGGAFDRDCQQVILVGDVCLVEAKSPEERQKAYGIRRHWVRLTEQLTARSLPSVRSQMLLTQFEQYFDSETVAQLPDLALALLVGVFPQTIRMARVQSAELSGSAKADRS